MLRCAAERCVRFSKFRGPPRMQLTRGCPITAADSAKLPAKVTLWQWLPEVSLVGIAEPGTRRRSPVNLGRHPFDVGGRDETSCRTRAAPRGRSLRLAATAAGRNRA